MTNSLHDESNENGNKFISFALSNNMVVVSTTFEHKRIHGYLLREKRKVKVDLLLIDSRHFFKLTDVKTYEGANIDSYWCETKSYNVENRKENIFFNFLILIFMFLELDFMYSVLL